MGRKQLIQNTRKVTGIGSASPTNPKNGCTDNQKIKYCSPSKRCIDQGEKMHKCMDLDEPKIVFFNNLDITYFKNIKTSIRRVTTKTH